MVTVGPPKQRKILIAIIYSPPSGSAIAVIDHLDTTLSSFGAAEITSEIVILGDFNIDYKKSSTPDCKYLKEFERGHQLKQYI